MKSKSGGQELCDLTVTVHACNSNWGTCIAPPLLEDWVCIRVNPYLDARTQNETNVFRSRWNECIDSSSFSSIGSLFYARGAATEKTMSPIRRHVRGTTRLTQHKLLEPRYMRKLTKLNLQSLIEVIVGELQCFRCWALTESHWDKLLIKLHTHAAIYTSVTALHTAAASSLSSRVLSSEISRKLPRKISGNYSNHSRNFRKSVNEFFTLYVLIITI